MHVDPRLLKQAGAARGYLAVTVGCGLAGAGLIIAQAGLLSQALAGAAHGTGIAALSGTLIWLGVVLAGRAIAVSAGFTAPMLGKKLVSTTYRLSSSWALQSVSRTEEAGSVPNRQVPAWCAQPATGMLMSM